MKKLIFLICLCLFGVSSYAQDTIFAIQKNVAKSDNPVIILIHDSVLNANATFDQNVKAYFGKQVVLKIYTETLNASFHREEYKVTETLFFNKKTGKNDINKHDLFLRSYFNWFLPISFFVFAIVSFLFSWALGKIKFSFLIRSITVICTSIFLLLLSCFGKDFFLMAISIFLGSFIPYLIFCLTAWRQEIKLMIQKRLWTWSLYKERRKNKKS